MNTSPLFRKANFRPTPYTNDIHKILEPLMPDEETIELAAKTAHEVNRAYCQGLGDFSQPAWDDAPEWQKGSALSGVRGVIAGNGPKESHECWLKQKTEEGWKYGAIKDPEKKEHPCFIPYEQLPDAQKFKDALFINAVRGVLGMAAHTTSGTVTLRHDPTSKAIRSMRRAVKAAVNIYATMPSTQDAPGMVLSLAMGIFYAANPGASPGDPC